MFNLPSVVLASSSLFLNLVLCSPLSASYTNVTSSSPTASSTGGPSDSSCGGCKIVADSAHLLYWNPILHILVEEDTYHGITPTETFTSVSHAVTVTQSLPVAKATRTVIFSNPPDYYSNNTSLPTTPAETISGFTA